MICSFCNREVDMLQIGWDETSHFGKRTICYGCILERDIKRMQNKKNIILKKEKGNLINQTNTLFFKIIEEKIVNGVMFIYFLFQKKRWIGKLFPDSNNVYCSKFNKLSFI